MPVIINPQGVNINMSDFTDNVVTSTSEWTVSGDGIFDILMSTGTSHLLAQLNAGRIRGEDYATAYVQLYQTNMSAAVQIWLQKPLLDAQKTSEDAKNALYRRQIEGFDEDYKQKILKIMMDAWAVGFSVARDSFEASGIPAPMQKVTIDDVFNKFVVTELDNYKYGRLWAMNESVITP